MTRKLFAGKAVCGGSIREGSGHGRFRARLNPFRDGEARGELRKMDLLNEIQWHAIAAMGSD